MNFYLIRFWAVKPANQEEAFDENIDTDLGKGNKMRSPSLLSGPKIRKAYFETSSSKILIYRPPLKSVYNWKILFITF